VDPLKFQNDIDLYFLKVYKLYIQKIGVFKEYSMGRQTRKLNFLIEETICQDLEALVSAGKRSKVVNEALRKELELIRRKRAVEKLYANFSKGKRFSSQEIVNSLTKDRRVH